MSKADKLLDSMRRNPAGDWSIQDVQRLCDGLGWRCPPLMGGGLHWKVEVPGSEAILTIPAHRPIKPVSIRKLTDAVKDYGDGQDD